LNIVLQSIGYVAISNSDNKIYTNSALAGSGAKVFTSEARARAALLGRARYYTIVPAYIHTNNNTQEVSA
jgi:hypothetical protein